MKSSNSIQENNNLQKKMVEQTYHKVLSEVVDELLHSFLAVFTPQQASLIRLGSRSRVVAYKKEMLSVKYIYK